MLSLKFGAHENGRESELVELVVVFLAWIRRRCRLVDSLGEAAVLGDEDNEMEA